MVSLRLLGRTGVRVSKLCLGTWMFGTRTDEPESRRILSAALDAGINFVDTANRYGRDVVNPTADYGGGLSEEYIGRALKERGASVRQQIVLATKVFGAVGPRPNDRGHSRVHVFAALEDSLRRLQTDYVDLYYLHWPDPDTALDEAARTMDDLVRAGKVRYWATSNHPAWKVTRLHWLCAQHGLHPPVAEQSPYSLLNRALEREVLPCARELGFAVNPYSPLAGGLLTGKYHAGAAPPADSRATWNRGTARRAQDEHTTAVVRAATGIAGELGKPLSQVALNWVAAQPGVTCPIIGPRTLEQFQDNAGALEWDLPPESASRLSELAPVG
ncbi:MAG TPA: aldo/keto reductase [Chloroflexota bacterium]|nr:aldo/keto reductase [Chloroflexota bacterium]